MVNKYWFILASDALLKDTFKHPPMFTYKRSQNLATMLVRSDVIHDDKKKQKNIQGCFPCRNCTTICSANSTLCSSILQCKNYTCSSTKRIYHIKSYITCLSKNVIHLLQCPLIYVGKTFIEFFIYIYRGIYVCGIFSWCVIVPNIAFNHYLLFQTDLNWSLWTNYLIV